MSGSISRWCRFAALAASLVLGALGCSNTEPDPSCDAPGLLPCNPTCDGPGLPPCDPNDDTIPLNHCRIDGNLVIGMSPNPANGCQRCEPGRSNTAWTNATNGSTCAAGTCEEGVCVSTCSYGGQTYPVGAVIDADTCQACNGHEFGATVGQAPDGTPCSAGYCAWGACQSGCWIDGTFTLAEMTNPDNPCEVCQPARSTTGWTTRDESATCYSLEGTGYCTGGSCVVACLIDEVSWNVGEENPDEFCQVCAGGPFWSPKEHGTSCGDEMECRGSGYCADLSLAYTRERIGGVSATHYALWGASADDLLLGSTDGIRRSTDRGQSWTLATRDHGGTVRAFARGGEKRFALAQGGLFASTDSGANWTRVSTYSDVCSDVVAVTDAELFIACNGGVLFRTTNGGVILESETTGTDRDLRGLARTPDGTLFAVGGSGTILRRRGGTWSSLTSDTTRTLDAVHAIDDDELWVLGQDGTVLHTTDGGDTWTPVDTGFEGSTYAMSSGADGLFVAGQSGALLWRTATGTRWLWQDSRMDTHVFTVWSDGDGFVVAAGGDGWVTRTP